MIGHYYSESKDRWIPFSEMADQHVVNAWAKLGRSYYADVSEAEQAGIAEGVAELAGELLLRGYVRTDDGWTRMPTTDDAA